MKQPHVAIIGAGWAGLAAASELTCRGVPVTLLEAAAVPGGRARGFTRHGKTLDNGQHILLGAYRETLCLMKKVGLREQDCLLRLPLRLYYPEKLNLSVPKLPAPMHLFVALLTAQGLSTTDRWAALRWISRLRWNNFTLKQDITVAALLADQPARLVQLLWEPLCLAALNTTLKEASAQIFLNVLRDSLNGNRLCSDLLLPRTDLSSIFPHAAINFITAHGGKVKLSTAVSSIESKHHAYQVNGETFSHIICAVSAHAVSKLLRHLPEMAEVIQLISRFTYQPISTIYLQYPDTTRLPFPMIGFADGNIHWLFDRGVLCDQKGLLAGVISAHGSHCDMTQEQLAQAVHDEICTLLGPLPQPDWQQVIVEKRATFTCQPNLHRPKVTISDSRIFLAGDYTAGDYPATLEGAVRSGLKSAHQLIASLQ